MTKPKPFYPLLSNEEYVVAEGIVNCSSSHSIFDMNPFGWIGIKTNLPTVLLKKCNTQKN